MYLILDLPGNCFQKKKREEDILCKLYHKLKEKLLKKVKTLYPRIIQKQSLSDSSKGIFILGFIVLLGLVS